MVLAAVHKLPVVQQVVELSTVDLVKREIQTHLRITLKKVADVKSCQQIQTRVASIGLAHHGESLSTSSLPVSEASGLSPSECVLYQRLHTYLIDLQSY